MPGTATSGPIPTSDEVLSRASRNSGREAGGFEFDADANRVRPSGSVNPDEVGVAPVLRGREVVDLEGRGQVRAVRGDVHRADVDLVDVDLERASSPERSTISGPAAWAAATGPTASAAAVAIRRMVRIKGSSNGESGRLGDRMGRCPRISFLTGHPLLTGPEPKGIIRAGAPVVPGRGPVAMMGGVADLDEHLTGWAPEPVETTARIGAWPGEAFAALLDQPPPGDELPPMWHGFHLLDHPAQAELGDDGHPAHGRFLPPIPDRRRMFAGGRLEVRTPLRVGDLVTRRSSVLSAVPKSGRSGAMVLVTQRHEFTVDNALVLVEEHDFAYRSQPAGTARALAEPAVPDEPAAQWRLGLTPDPTMLFRFSALTYNTHRIHYDHPYVTGVEGYTGLVVHGPLLALLLLELPRRFAPDRRVTGFAYRLRQPAVAGTPVVARGGPDELWAGVPGRAPAVTGRVTLT